MMHFEYQRDQINNKQEELQYEVEELGLSPSDAARELEAYADSIIEDLRMELSALEEARDAGTKTLRDLPDPDEEDEDDD